MKTNDNNKAIAQEAIAASTTDKVLNKSKAMRQMYAAGMSKGEIANALGVRYQFVQNVIGKTQ